MGAARRGPTRPRLGGLPQVSFSLALQAHGYDLTTALSLASTRLGCPDRGELRAHRALRARSAVMTDLPPRTARPPGPAPPAPPTWPQPQQTWRTSCFSAALVLFFLPDPPSSHQFFVHLRSSFPLFIANAAVAERVLFHIGDVLDGPMSLNAAGVAVTLSGGQPSPGV